MLASAFIHKPKLFLDEPFANLDPIYQRKCRNGCSNMSPRGTIFLCSRPGNGRAHVQSDGDHQRWKGAAAGTVKGLKQTQTETLEDVFIRLVGRSIEDVERLSDEGGADDSEE